jgi:hypothetical protein
LIIDDCSTDDTESIGRKLVVQDKRVEYSRHNKNTGHIATYNEGLLEWADTDYVLLLSADDMLAPGALARAVSVLDKHQDVGMCYGQHVEFNDHLPELSLEHEKQNANVEVMSGLAFLEMCCKAGANPVGTPTAVVRALIQRKVGGYRAELPHAADLEMWLRCACKGQVAKLNEVQAFKRQHPGNMAKKFTRTILPDLKQRRLAFESALKGCDGKFNNANELLEIAVRSLADHAFWVAQEFFEIGCIAESNALLGYALTLDASWASRAEWKRFRLKRWFGPKIWKLINSIPEFSRGKSNL